MNRAHRSPKKNLQLRAWLIENDVKMKDVAEQMGIMPQTLSVWFSVQMSDEAQEEIKIAAKKVMVLREHMEKEKRRYEEVF